jgi:hypothetical protein
MSKQARSRLVLGLLVSSYLTAISVLASDPTRLHLGERTNPINFGRLAPGMTKVEVEAILGQERLEGCALNGSIGEDTWLGRRFRVDLTFDAKGLLVSKSITSHGAFFFEQAYVWLNGW